MKELIEIKIPIRRRIQGFYKASVMEWKDGRLNEVSSTDWKPNHITDAGLNKLAHMPWAQVFQFCVAGTKVGPTAPADGDTLLEEPVAMSAFYMTGAGGCGHEIVGGDTLRLYRTFDFYKERTNRLYTEIGFMESPTASSLFSRIVLSPAQKVHACQFLRIGYELRIELSPTVSAAPSPVPTITGWTLDGVNDREALQLIGMAGIDSTTGMATTIDDGGFCNEPFAPGSRSFGPGFGYVNRWKNGSAVNYISGTDPYTDIGPLTNYNATYNNPHEYITKILDVVKADPTKKGRFHVSGTPFNYWDLVFFQGMAGYHGYTVSTADDGTNGKRSLTVTPGGDMDGTLGANNITHLMQPEAKYEPGGSAHWHALNSFFFDPPLENDDSYHTSKSHVEFPGGVQQPGVGAPYWDDWSVAGASCFLSTSSDAPAAFQSTADRATGKNVIELPLRLDPYVAGSFTRTKYVVFDTLNGNRSDWRTIGIGATSLDIIPANMLNAATKNGYVYVMQNANEKLNTHQLKISFVYTWARV